MKKILNLICAVMVTGSSFAQTVENFAEVKVLPDTLFDQSIVEDITYAITDVIEIINE